MMSHQKFQQELRSRGIDGQVAYMMSLLFEACTEALKQTETNANVLNGIVDTVGNVVQLHHHTQQGLKELNAQVNGEVAGVTITTEPGKGN